ncbi:hypothetical protein ILUMI_02734 [Ignelater luminosus]|uniref:Uncharacterized protein n=1 Tax=Ignelater luminosus TaxID=2038154 RepID=A0A8K0DHP5_IGNLU|nr:hypothetical protein ILUMI_02734 [Ignelater luminosus]
MMKRNEYVLRLAIENKLAVVSESIQVVPLSENSSKVNIRRHDLNVDESETNPIDSYDILPTPLPETDNINFLNAFKSATCLCNSDIENRIDLHDSAPFQQSISELKANNINILNTSDDATSEEQCLPNTQHVGKKLNIQDLVLVQPSIHSHNGPQTSPLASKSIAFIDPDNNLTNASISTTSLVEQWLLSSQFLEKENRADLQELIHVQPNITAISTKLFPEGDDLFNLECTNKNDTKYKALNEPSPKSKESSIVSASADEDVRSGSFSAWKRSGLVRNDEYSNSDDIQHNNSSGDEHHEKHKDVIKIKSLKPGSKERLSLVAALRKQAYFHLYVEKNVLNPVRTSNNPKSVCTYCLGHYSKNLLYKHVKQCRNIPSDVINPGKRCTSTSQTFMASMLSKNHEYLRTSRIKKEVFDIMRADEVSGVAKSDPLTCL